MVPSDHPVAGRDSVTLSELAGEDWITAMPGSPYHALFIAAFTAAGVTPTIAHESVEWETSAALVGAGVGVSLVPRLASLAGEANVRRVRLTGTGRLSRKIIAAVRTGDRGSPLIRESLRHLKATSRGFSPPASARRTETPGARRRGRLWHFDAVNRQIRGKQTAFLSVDRVGGAGGTLGGTAAPGRRHGGEPPRRFDSVNRLGASTRSTDIYAVNRPSGDRLGASTR